LLQLVPAMSELLVEREITTSSADDYVLHFSDLEDLKPGDVLTLWIPKAGSIADRGAVDEANVDTTNYEQLLVPIKYDYDYTGSLYASSSNVKMEGIRSSISDALAKAGLSDFYVFLNMNTTDKYFSLHQKSGGGMGAQFAQSFRDVEKVAFDGDQYVATAPQGVLVTMDPLSIDSVYPTSSTNSLEYSADGGSTWSTLSAAYVALGGAWHFQYIPTSSTGTIIVRDKNDTSLTKSITVSVDTTDPSAPTYAVSGTDMTVTGEADADVYLIRDDGGTTAGSIKYDVIDKIGTDDTAALQHLLAQDTHEWARGTIASGGATGTIDTSGLMDGTYKLYQVDRAGNFSLVSTDGDLTISSSSVTDGDTSTHEYDVEFGSIYDGSSTFTKTANGAGVVSSGNNAVDLTFDLNDVAENDIVELYVDGQLAFSKEITASDKTTGTITTTNLNLDEKDVASGTSSSSVNATDNAVILELKVKHQGVYVQDGQDVTWDYQW